MQSTDEQVQVFVLAAVQATDVVESTKSESESSGFESESFASESESESLRKDSSPSP